MNGYSPYKKKMEKRKIKKKRRDHANENELNEANSICPATITNMYK